MLVNREEQEELALIGQEARQRIRRKKDSGDCTTYLGEESEL